MKNIVLAFLLALSISNCGNQLKISEHVDLFIHLYQERSDFDGFLELYSTDMVLEDMVTGTRIEGRDQFAEFFNWPDARFKKLEEDTIIIQNKVVQDNTAVISGYFTPFSWNGQEVEAMQFTTWLYFDEEGKIVKHVDWINYPNSLIDYSTRTNANSWISP